MAGIDLRQERYESGFEMINEYRVPSSSKRSGGASDFLANNRFILLILLTARDLFSRCHRNIADDLHITPPLS